MRWLIVVVAILVGGCASFHQASDTVLIREPGLRTYGPPVDRSESAKAIWEYAVLSENAYFGAWKKQRRIPTPTQEARVFEPPPHLAYSMPPTSSDGVAVPRVSYVYAFDPSPVTGWYSVDAELRTPNAADSRNRRSRP